MSTGRPPRPGSAAEPTLRRAPSRWPRRPLPSAPPAAPRTDILLCAESAPPDRPVRDQRGQPAWV